MLSGTCPHSPTLRGKRLQELNPGRLASFLTGRKPLPLTARAFRQSRRSRDGFFLGLKASSAASVSSVADQAPHSGSQGTSSSPLTSLSRRWHSYWSLGRPQRQQQEKNPKKLSKIVSKLWSIMDVNKLLLTAALFCMVSSAHEATHHCLVSRHVPACALATALSSLPHSAATLLLLRHGW